MSVTSAWRNFWFREGPYFDLAVVRLLVVGFQLFWMLNTIFPWLFYVNALPDELYSPIYVLRLMLLPFNGMEVIRPEAGIVFAVFWATFLMGLFAFAGALTSVSLLLFAAGSWFLTAYIYSFEDFHHPEAVLMIALAVLALAPSGRVLSIDSLLFKPASTGGGRSMNLIDYVGRDAAWPILLLQCFIALMYISAVTSKLSWGGLDWMNGYTLQYKMIQDGLRKPSALASWAGQHHTAMMLASIVTIVFQATYFLNIFFPRLRWIYVPLGLAFHVGIYVTLKAPFPHWIIVYAVYIPWAAAIRYIADSQVHFAVKQEKVGRATAPPIT